MSSSERCIWHWKAPNFMGTHIVDLYTLRMLSPERFKAASAKYLTTTLRRLLLVNNPIPILDVIWNEAIHTSTVHPQKIHDAKRAAGVPVDPIEYFEIPVEKLKEHEAVVWSPDSGLWLKLTVILNVLLRALGLTRWLVQSDYARLDINTWRALEAVPEPTLRAYKAWGEEIRAGGAPQILTYINVPHVFVKGSIPIEGLKVIRIE